MLASIATPAKSTNLNTVIFHCSRHHYGHDQMAAIAHAQLRCRSATGPMDICRRRIHELLPRVSLLPVVTLLDHRSHAPRCALLDSPLRRYVLPIRRPLFCSRNHGDRTVPISREAFHPTALRIFHVRNREGFAKSVATKVDCDFREESVTWCRKRRHGELVR